MVKKTKNEDLELEPKPLDAEKGVLGSILLKAEIADEVGPVLDARDFSDHANGILYRHLLEICQTGRRMDTTLLKNKLEKSGDYETVGGMAYVGELTRCVPHAGHAMHYAKIVRDAATLRELIYAGREIVSRAFANELEADDVLNSSEQLIANIRDSRVSSSERISTIREILNDAMSELERRGSGEASVGLSTGFEDIDQKMLLRPGELVVVAGRPSMGKSAFAASLALNVALYESQPVLLVSLEMSSAQLGERMISTIGKVDNESLSRGRLTSQERDRTVEAIATLSSLKIEIDESSDRSVRDIAAVARRQKRRIGLGLIVVDYLQLVTPSEQRDPREQQVAKLSKAFKQLAREMNVPVVLLAQLNRQAENTKDSRPRLNHLRESGAIEQDADVVLFVHRQEYYMTPDERETERRNGDKKGQLGTAEIIIGKQRNGSVGEIKLEWQSAFTRFDDYRRMGINYEPAFDAYSTHT